MKAHTVATIYAKELLDVLRDRRALLSMVVFPILFMPVLVFGLGAVARLVVQQARSEVPVVMLVGGADSPTVRAELERSGKFRVEPASPDWRARISEKRVRAAAEIPPGFERALRAGAAPDVTLYDYQGEMKSGMAAEELVTFFDGLRDRASARLLSERGLPPSMARPFAITRVNVAPPEKVGGNALGGIVPYFIIFLCLVGAMYPAMDLTAGEKERGTMETLLCSPATRSEIVAGKFLLVLTSSLFAVLSSLASLSVTLLAAAAALRAEPASARPPEGLFAIDPFGVLGVLAMVAPVAVLFSAVLLSLSLFAKSMKEAQAYVTPITFLLIVPIGIGALPGIELGPGLSLVPILNISLVCREMLSGVWHWGYIGIIFASTAAYAFAALAVAVRMFRSESVLFRT